jgi:hypothetical protein
LIARGNLENLCWHPNGSELFFVQDHALRSVTVKHDQTLQIGQPSKLFDIAPSFVMSPGEATEFDVASTGDRFVWVRRAPTDNSRQQVPTALLVENWFEEFREKQGQQK